jgi:hypothetical protein
MGYCINLSEHGLKEGEKSNSPHLKMTL